jgi:hypothetical protein
MANRRVRVGSIYHFVPVMLDKIHPLAGAECREGDKVRVINLPMAPKANTMGHCYIEHLEGHDYAKAGDFVGLCCTNSLIPQKEYPAYLEAVAAQS